jgi:hypothetical protein
LDLCVFSAVDVGIYEYDYCSGESVKLPVDALTHLKAFNPVSSGEETVGDKSDLKQAVCSRQSEAVGGRYSSADPEPGSGVNETKHLWRTFEISRSGGPKPGPR